MKLAGSIGTNIVGERVKINSLALGARGHPPPPNRPLLALGFHRLCMAQPPAK